MFWNVSWWRGVNSDHNLHTEKHLIRLNGEFVCGMLHLLQHFFLPTFSFCHFWLEALKSNFCLWILFNYKSSFSIHVNDLSEISTSFVISLLFFREFFTFFLTTSMTFLVIIERHLPRIGFDKIDCHRIRNIYFLQIFICFITPQLFIPAILNVKIWLHFFLAVIFN